MLSLAVAVVLFLVINISTSRADYGITGKTAIIAADTKVYNTTNLNEKPWTTLKKGTVVTILGGKNLEEKYNWLLVEFNNNIGWVYVNPTINR